MNKYEWKWLRKVTGKWLKDAYNWLREHEDEGGCYHIGFGNSGSHEVCVCVGWTKRDYDGPEKWYVAWKIGWQTFNNAMQCDLDIDFSMPWNTKEYCDRMNAKLTKAEKKRGFRYCEGDVYDTEEIIELKPGGRAPKGYRNWDALAAFIRKTARDVLKFAREVDPVDPEEE